MFISRGENTSFHDCFFRIILPTRMIYMSDIYSWIYFEKEEINGLYIQDFPIYFIYE